MLIMCAHYERVLMTQEIMRSKDTQCKREPSWTGTGMTRTDTKFCAGIM